MVVIKQMDMPDWCENCELSDMSVCLVTRHLIERVQHPREEKRPRWCPLTEVQQYGPKGTLYKEVR